MPPRRSIPTSWTETYITSQRTASHANSSNLRILSRVTRLEQSFQHSARIPARLFINTLSHLLAWPQCSVDRVLCVVSIPDTLRKGWLIDKLCLPAAAVVVVLLLRHFLFATPERLRLSRVEGRGATFASCDFCSITALISHFFSLSPKVATIPVPC